MKVAVGLFYLECNSFNPNFVTEDNFIYAEGEEVKKFIHVCDIFDQQGIEIVPTIMASTIPSANLKKDSFLNLVERLLKPIIESNVDGIWLHLHGSMQVEEIGSGELYIVKKLREIVGDNVPIGITLDPHANNDEKFCDYINIVRGYHTIPHYDQPESERVTASLLLKMMQSKILVKPSLITIPMIISGEKGLDSREPLKSIYTEIEYLESLEEIASVTAFMGDPWSDCPNSHLSVAVVPSAPEHSDFAYECCKKLAKTIFERKDEFVFEAPTLPPQEALDLALSAKSRPIFLSDSGDNTTGGGVGNGTEMLRLLLSQNKLTKKILITPIWDNDCYHQCISHSVGESFSLTLGQGNSEISKSVNLNATLLSTGVNLGYLNNEQDICGNCCTLRINDFIDVMISDSPTSFISYPHFKAGGIVFEDYDIIVLKQGYLFAQLRPYTSEGYIMAATKGATYQFIEELPYKNLKRPIYPLDQDVEFNL